VLLMFHKCAHNHKHSLQLDAVTAAACTAGKATAAASFAYPKSKANIPYHSICLGVLLQA
jgi:hypothetical protein